MMTRRCSRCGETKDAETGFYKRPHVKVPEPVATCKACQIVKAGIWKKANKARHDASRRRSEQRLKPVRNARKYGLSADEFMARLRAQGSRCAICRRALDMAAKKKSHRPHIDHDHATKQVRGILCQTCNTAIGLLGDSPKLLARARRYVLPFTPRAASDEAYRQISTSFAADQQTLIF